MGLATFSLGSNLVGFEVNEDGRPVVAFGRWSGEGETQEVEHVLTISEECLMSVAGRSDGLSVVISENGHNVRLSGEEIWQLRKLFVVAKSLLENYQAWLAEWTAAGRMAKVTVEREWQPSPRGPA